MSLADERARASNAAKTEFEKALVLAEKITDAWYRCQSLAAVARFAPEEEVIRIANKALSAASLAGDAYKRVAAGAWPVRALAERGKVQSAERAILSLLEESALIEHPVSKMAALGVLWAASWPLPAKIKQPALSALLSACQATDSWKSGRLMRDTALVVAAEDRPQALRIIASMRESRYQRQAQKRLAAGDFETVPRFFANPVFDNCAR